MPFCGCFRPQIHASSDLEVEIPPSTDLTWELYERDMVGGAFEPIIRAIAEGNNMLSWLEWSGEPLLDFDLVALADAFSAPREVQALEAVSFISASLTDIQLRLFLPSMVCLQPRLELISFKDNDLSSEIAEDLACLILKLPSLKVVDISGNDLQEGPALPILGRAIAESQLEEINVSETKLSDAGFEQLFRGHHFLHLQRLKAESLRISPQSLRTLMSFIKRCPSLESLNLAHNRLFGDLVSDEDQVLDRVKGFCYNLAANENVLRDIDFGDTNMMDLHFGFLLEAFIRLWNKDQRILTLNCSHNLLTERSTRYLYRAYRENPEVLRIGLLDLEHNALQDAGCIPMSKLFQGIQIGELRIGHNMMTSQGLEPFFTALHATNAPTALSVACSLLTAQCIRSLADSLHAGATLRKIDLSHCSLTDGAAVGYLVKQSHQLEELILNENPFGSDALFYLFDALVDSSSRSIIRRLHLANCNLDDRALIYFFNLCKSCVFSSPRASCDRSHCPWIRFLDISQNRFTGAGYAALFELLTVVPIQTLVLQNTSLSVIHLNAAIQFVAQSTLQVLDCRNCRKLSNKGMTRMEIANVTDFYESSLDALHDFEFLIDVVL